MIIEGNTAVPYGYGAFSDVEGGVPKAASFNGQANWWGVPNSWYCMTDSGGQLWVSPNADFSAPKYAAKINQDGTWVFQDKMASLAASCGLATPFGR